MPQLVTPTLNTSKKPVPLASLTTEIEKTWPISNFKIVSRGLIYPQIQAIRHKDDFHSPAVSVERPEDVFHSPEAAPRPQKVFPGARPRGRLVSSN